MRTLALTAALSFAAVVAPRPARAGGRAASLLVQARQHVAALEYAQARTDLERALAAGDSGPAQLTAIYLLCGQVAGGLGDGDQAADCFRHLLVLDPDFELPAGTSPKLTQPFGLARAFVRDHGRLRVHREAQPGRLVLVIDSDPLSMVSGARVRYLAGGKPWVLEARGAGRIPVALPPAAARAVVAAIDDRGNELVVLDSPASGAPAGRAATRPARPAPVRPSRLTRTARTAPPVAHPFYARTGVWAVATLVVAAAGTGFGLAELHAQHQLDQLNRDSATQPFSHDYSQAQAIERRGHRYAVLADVSFGVTAATGVVALVLWLRDRHAQRRTRATLGAPEARAQLAPAWLPGGAAGVALHLRY